MLSGDYYYLMSSLILLLALAIGAVLFPTQRRAMLVSGLLSAPFALASVLFVPEYWRPKRIAVFLAGPEDLLFSFAGGGLVWLAATGLVRPHPTVSLRAGRVARRYLTLTVTFFLMVLACKYVLGLTTMMGVFISGGLHWVALLTIRPDLLRFSATTGLGYSFAYTLFCILVFAVWPGFSNQWNWGNLIGLTIAGVPIEESIWALVFAACWALGMGYAFEVRLPDKADSI
ncbi:MAG: lycopene cyclase domain-containing protein [Thermoanaerobaculales bacterium]